MKEKGLPKVVRELYDLIESGKFEEAKNYFDSDSNRAKEINLFEESSAMLDYLKMNEEKASKHIEFHIYYFNNLNKQNN